MKQLTKVIQSTKRQKAAVRYCENWLSIEFTGNIENFVECSLFLSEYLEEAKQTEMELRCEYETYLWDKL